MITVESEVGLGTAFHIYLPVSGKQEPQKAQVKDKPIHGNGKILVMDDEEMLRNFVGELLDLLGYDANFAIDGHETIEVYCRAKDNGTPFDCVLMDLTIPGGMGGREAIQRLLEIDPSIRAVVSSGYSDDPVMADFQKYGFCGVVAKPYDAEQLSEVLHRVINR
jgi:CheY-like chemotaxis protein